MSRPTQTLPDATGRVRDHFRKKAFSFDHLYDEEHAVQRALRPGLFRRREFALGIVREYGEPRVLDVGCGSARVGELALEAGASRYVGVDFSEPMLDLARERLERFESRVELVHGDFRSVPLYGGFDVVIALGFFDYQGEPEAYVRRMAEVCTGSVVGSFPRWNWVKGPVRKLRYEVINNCPIFDYTEAGLRRLFGDNGFSRVEVHQPGRGGYLVCAAKT